MCVQLCVSGSDNKVLIWNCGTEEIITEVEFPDLVLSVSWSYTGHRVVTGCKDKKVRIVDPRSGEIVKVSQMSCRSCRGMALLRSEIRMFYSALDAVVK